jgi:hypothetical protein
MAESRKSGNNRLDLPNKGKAYFDQAFGVNKNQLPIVNQGWNGQLLTINDNGVISLTSNIKNALTASFLPVGTYQITSSWAQSASNALRSISASRADTASFITPTGTNVFTQGGNSFGTTALLGTNDNQDLQLETSGSVRMTISSSGRVGIGTTTPTALLDVSGSTIIRGALTASNISASSWISGSDLRISNTTTIGGTLGVTGATTLVGALTASNISASSWISGSDLRISNTTTIGGTLGVTGIATFANDLNSPSFFSGFAGSGWRLDYVNPKYSLEVDDLTVRGTMKVYELLISQIRATNGSIFVSNTGKVETATDLGNNTYYLTFDTGSQYGHSFKVGDIIRAQRFNITASTIYQCNLVVAGVPNTQVLTASFNGVYGTSSYGIGVYGAGITSITPPTGGMEFVRLGSTIDTNRQGTVYLTADDNNSPFIDVKDGVTGHSGFNSANTTKVRMGKLSGVISPLFGSLSGYGLWASGSAYLEGTINATAGKIGGFTITNDAISGTGFFLSGSATGNDFFISSSNFNVKADGTITASAGLIGGFNTTITEIKTTGSITAVDNDTRTSITYPNLSLNKDGNITGSSLVLRKLIPSASTNVSYKLVDTETGVADFKNIGRPILTFAGSSQNSNSNAWNTLYESPPCYLLPGENLLLITAQFYGNTGTGSNGYNPNSRAGHNARIIVATASGSNNPQLINTPLYDGFAGRTNQLTHTWWSNGLSLPYYPGSSSYFNNWITGSDPASYIVWQLSGTPGTSQTNIITRNAAPSGGISIVISPTSSLGVAIIPTGSRGQFVKFFIQTYTSKSSADSTINPYTNYSNITLTTTRGYTAASVGGGVNVYDPASNYALLG